MSTKMIKISAATVMLLWMVAVPSSVSLVSRSSSHYSFVHQRSRHAAPYRFSATVAPSAEQEEALEANKKKLLDLLQKQTKPMAHPVLADPITKEGVTITSQSASATLFGGQSLRNRRVNYVIESPSNTFSGSSDTFLNMLEPKKTSESDDNNASSAAESLRRNLVVFVPPPIRSALATAGLPGMVSDDYAPMRDLFQSPTVSFAYERGWRQGFARAGFPGPDKEAAMAMEYFEPCMANSDSKILVDMSCATGLFTRRFAKSGCYNYVLGCDYSASMLLEARRRIGRDPELASLTSTASNDKTRLELVRLDVGQIPMKDESVDALHAGAAMHCWPDLPAAASEIHRVLKPGGRYFATTFLSSYFGMLQQAEGGATGPSRQAFQYFESLEQLKSLMESGGFERDEIEVELLGSACVVIRCEKKKS